MSNDESVIYCGDNLEKMPNISNSSVDLVYIDPPFNSNRDYSNSLVSHAVVSFKDRYDSVDSYIKYMEPRCDQLVLSLKSTGSFYYHCDSHASHYIKIMLDRIFGLNGFRSEIIWKRSTSHGNVTRNYGSLYDSILFYTKSKKYTWNQCYEPYTEDYIKSNFRYKDEDGRVWRSVTLRNPGVRPNLRFPYTASDGVTYQPHPNGWSCNRERLEKYDREGRLHFPAKSGGKLNVKFYLDESKGVKLQNVWMDIPAIAPQAKERKDVDFPTQKPILLLDRIIQTSSNPGDIVLDAFCGSGTTLVAAHKLDRRWIGIDDSQEACRIASDRLQRECGLIPGRDFTVR